MPAIPIKITNTSVSSDVYGLVRISWSVSGPSHKIDHFIIMASRPGYSFPCGVRHHYSETKSYEFVDTTQAKIQGGVKYSIIPVFLDFSRGTKKIAGAVPIV